MSVHFAHSGLKCMEGQTSSESFATTPRISPGIALSGCTGQPRRSCCMGYSNDVRLGRAYHTGVFPRRHIVISRAGMLSPAFTFVAGSVLLCPANRRLFALVPLVCRGNFSPHFALSGSTDRTQKKNSRKSTQLNLRESRFGKLICAVECVIRAGCCP